MMSVGCPEVDPRIVEHLEVSEFAQVFVGPNLDNTEKPLSLYKLDGRQVSVDAGGDGLVPDSIIS
jgi:hypothetical protein